MRKERYYGGFPCVSAISQSIWGAMGSPAHSCQSPSQRHSIAVEAKAVLPTLCPEHKVQQLLQHLKEIWGVSRHPEGFSYTLRILQANPSNSAVRHHFPGCFSKQKGGEHSVLLLSLSERLIAGDEEKLLWGMGSSILVIFGEYLHKGESSWIHARSRMIVYFWQSKTLAVGLMTVFPWVGTRTS